MSDRAAILALKDAVAQIVEGVEHIWVTDIRPLQVTIACLIKAKALLEQVDEELGVGLPIEEVIAAGQAKVEESRDARRQLDTRTAILRDKREP